MRHFATLSTHGILHHIDWTRQPYRKTQWIPSPHKQPLYCAQSRTIPLLYLNLQTYGKLPCLICNSICTICQNLPQDPAVKSADMLRDVYTQYTNPIYVSQICMNTRKVVICKVLKLKHEDRDHLASFNDRHRQWRLWTNSITGKSPQDMSHIKNQVQRHNSGLFIKSICIQVKTTPHSTQNWNMQQQEHNTYEDVTFIRTACVEVLLS